ncbi:MAG TPA: pitrilysin family protein [Polyangiales bacterium]|nr:pitrilysin family protein [Polyangiales bacterium]
MNRRYFSAGLSLWLGGLCAVSAGAQDAGPPALKAAPTPAPVAPPPGAATPASPAGAVPAAAPAAGAAVQPAPSAASLPAPTAPAPKPATAAGTPVPVEPAFTGAKPEQKSTLSALPIERHTLPNGLRVVLSPDRTIPTVGIAVYYDVGSRNEVPGRSGFAHLFEHMMFQGSANVQKGEHFQLILNRGGQMNGTTSEDRTNYYETLPSNELSLGLWLEADRMKSLAITQDNFENQRQTVMEERRQSYDNQPYARSFLRINELAYFDYFPYAHSTIGEMKDLLDAPLTAVQEFFDAYYAPNNAVLSLAGDFDSAEALALVTKYFGDIPARGRPEYTPGELNPQVSERSEVLTDNLAQLPAFHVAYHIPADREPDHYPLDLLSIALGDGDSARLYQELVKKRELLQSLNVGTDSRRGPDLFSVWAVAAQGKSVKTARDVIYQELAKVAKTGLTPRELEKAKNRVRSSFVFGLSSTLARAQVLGQFELYFGNAELLKSELEKYLAVTNEDIKRVAGKYFSIINRTVLDVVPSPAKAAEGGAQ